MGSHAAWTAASLYDAGSLGIEQAATLAGQRLDAFRESLHTHGIEAPPDPDPARATTALASD